MLKILLAVVCLVAFVFLMSCCIVAGYLDKAEDRQKIIDYINSAYEEGDKNV